MNVLPTPSETDDISEITNHIAQHSTIAQREKLKEITGLGLKHIESYLYWLETLSLMRSLSRSIVMIKNLGNRLRVKFSILSFNIIRLLANVYLGY